MERNTRRRTRMAKETRAFTTRRKKALVP